MWLNQPTHSNVASSTDFGLGQEHQWINLALRSPLTRHGLMDDERAGSGFSLSTSWICHPKQSPTVTFVRRVEPRAIKTMATLEDTFLSHWRDQQGIAPNLLLGGHVPIIQSVLAFLDAEPEALKLKGKVLRIFKNPNWLLEPGAFQEFVQTVGEAEFWMMATARGINLERIPEKFKQSQRTPDFRLASDGQCVPCFEVKTLSVIGGIHNLGQMNEESFQAQLSLSEQKKDGKKFPTAIHEAAPHGAVEEGKSLTTIIRNLIDKATNNIKSGQYSDAPTCLVLNLLLIDGHWNGNAGLRPVAFGYPKSWNIRSGVFWNLAFGKVGHLVFGIPEFEGKPTVEGELGREGILEANPDIKALLLIVHRWSEEPVFFGLKRESDDDLWLSSLMDMSNTFFKLVGDNWNDEGDTNGWRLEVH